MKHEQVHAIKHTETCTTHTFTVHKQKAKTAEYSVTVVESKTGALSAKIGRLDDQTSEQIEASKAPENRTAAEALKALRRYLRENNL